MMILIAGVATTVATASSAIMTYRHKMRKLTLPTPTEYAANYRAANAGKYGIDETKLSDLESSIDKLISQVETLAGISNTNAVEETRQTKGSKGGKSSKKEEKEEKPAESQKTDDKPDEGQKTDEEKQ